MLPHITNRSELDRWEQDNIGEAEAWAFRRKPKDLLSAKFICLLHKRMLGNVWQWAGAIRKREKNLGIEAWAIRPALKDLGQAGNCRERYMEALQAADRHDYGLLLKFVRS